MVLSGLEPLLALRDLSRSQLLDQLGASSDAVDEGVAYEGLAGVEHVHVPGAHPAHFYFQGERLVMIYESDPETDGAAALQHALGGPGAELRSRAGKRSVLHAYPEQGVAFSSEGDTVEFAEVFPPMPLERYKTEIYRDPGPFIE